MSYLAFYSRHGALNANPCETLEAAIKDLFYCSENGDAFDIAVVHPDSKQFWVSATDSVRSSEDIAKEAIAKYFKADDFQLAGKFDCEEGETAWSCTVKIRQIEPESTANE